MTEISSIYFPQDDGRSVRKTSVNKKNDDFSKSAFTSYQEFKQKSNAEFEHFKNESQADVEKFKNSHGKAVTKSEQLQNAKEPVSAPEINHPPVYYDEKDSVKMQEGATVKNPFNGIKEHGPVEYKEETNPADTTPQATPKSELNKINQDKSSVNEIPNSTPQVKDENKIKQSQDNNTFFSPNGDKISLNDNKFNIEDDVLGKVVVERETVLEYIKSKPSPTDLFNRASSAPVYKTENGAYKIGGQISSRMSYASARAQNYASGALYNNNKKYLTLTQKPPEELTQNEKDFMIQHEVAMAHFMVSTEK